MNVNRLVTLALLGVLAAAPAAASRRRAVESTRPTFNKEVVRILQQNCQTCHRPGGVGPFSLMTYEDVAPKASMIAAVTAARIMPPWKATPGCGTFQGDRSMSDGEIRTIARWLQLGKPQGDPADLPPPLRFDDEWELEDPDLVITMPEAYSADTDKDMFRMIPLPYVFPKDRYLTGIDIRSTRRHNVHHVAVHLDRTGQTDINDASDPGPGYDPTVFPDSYGFTSSGFLTAWLPGMRPRTLPEGTAMLIPQGSKVVLEMHYHPQEGRIDPDQTSVGLKFATSTVRQLVRYGSADNLDFVVPANVADYRVVSTRHYDRPSRLLGLQGHMHYLGRYLRATLHRPDGSTECLLQIDDWDRFWQAFYVYEQPVEIPAGSRVELECFYDNTLNNPRNLYNPPRDVPYGGRAEQEMCTLLQTFTYDDEQLAIEP